MNFVKPKGSDPFKNDDSVHWSLPEHRVFTLAHLSDFHLFSPNQAGMGTLLNKRAYGYISWRFHRTLEHNDQVVSALLEDVKLTRPDHMVLTGDLTHLGLPSEFLKAQELIRSLGTPSQVTVIPGNHDTYVDTPWDHTFHHWSEYMSSDEDCTIRGEVKDLQSLFPILRLRNGIALIGVSTARPTPWFSAVGSIGKMQMERLEKMLNETRRRGLLRIIAIHHPPVPGAISWRKRLTDLDELRSLLVRQGAELLLHGHTHRIFFGHLDTPFGSIPSIGVPSASSLGRIAERRARYHLLHLIKGPDGLDLLLSARVYSPSLKRFFHESEQRLALPRPN